VNSARGGRHGNLAISTSRGKFNTFVSPGAGDYNTEKVDIK